MIPDSKFRSRKFILAFAALVVSGYALIGGIIDGNAWFLCLGVILGLYGASNVMAGRS